MEKIIELAEKYSESVKNNETVFSQVKRKKELLAAIKEYRTLQAAPITEEWLKEHGFKNEYHGTWSKILHQWKDCDNFSHTIGVSVSSQNIYNTMEGELSLIVNADSKGYLSKSIYTLADLLDATSLCGINLED